MGEKNDALDARQDGSIASVNSFRTPEVDMQIATAKQYPRSLKTVLAEVKTQATLDDETAAAMSYAVPRAGKNITGPSVRLAEIFASAWGNLRAEMRVVGADKTHVMAEAMVWDLEKNVAIRCEVQRRITKKGGKRYDDDMIGVTGMAASSIAFRNAVFRVIPKAYVKQAQAHARQVAIGNVKNLTETRATAFEHFKRYGVTDERLLAALGKPSIEDVDAGDIVTLKGFVQSINEGMDVHTVIPPLETMKPGKMGFGKKAEQSEATDTPEDAPPEDTKPKRRRRAKPAEPAPEPETVPETEPEDEQTTLGDSEPSREEKAWAEAQDMYENLCDRLGEAPADTSKWSLEKLEAEVSEMISKVSG